MATKKKLILDSLENLSKEDYAKFCTALVDRGGERKVPKSKVEDLQRLEVTNALVSAFSEADAPGIVSELLESVGCVDEAKKLEAAITEFDKKSLNAPPEQKPPVTEQRPVQETVSPSVEREQIQKPVNPSVERDQVQKPKSQKTKKDASILKKIKEATQSLLAPKGTSQVAKTSPDVTIAKIDKKSLNASPEQTHCVTERRPVLGAIGPYVERDQFQRQESQGRSYGNQRSRTDVFVVEEPEVAQSLSPISRTTKVTMTSPDATFAQFNKMSLSSFPEETHHVTVWQSSMDKPSVFSDPFQRHDSHFERQSLSLLENHKAATKAMFDDLNAMTSPVHGGTMWRPSMDIAGPSVFSDPFQRHDSHFGRQSLSLLETHEALTKAMFDDLDARTFGDTNFPPNNRKYF
ncbi:uncharacterized protein LOC144199217 isoform X2 [Stigmatopora nigra]